MGGALEFWGGVCVYVWGGGARADGAWAGLSVRRRAAILCVVYVCVLVTCSHSPRPLRGCVGWGGWGSYLVAPVPSTRPPAAIK